MEAIARLGAAQCLASGVGTIGDASFSGAAATACADLGLRAIVYLEVFGPDASGLAERFEPARDRLEGTLPDRVRLGVSPHAPYTVGTSSTRPASSSDCRWRRISPRAPTSTRGSRRAAAAGSSSPTCSSRRSARPGSGRSRTRACSTSGCSPRTASTSTTRRSSCWRARRRRSPTVHARTPTSAAGSPRSATFIDAGVRVGLGTDSPASTPCFDVFDELRAAIAGARAREQRPDALSATEALELATLGAARALGLDDEIGSLTPGKQADLAVVSLEDSPFVPWEDPAAAVVLGGSPERVAATLVAGETRYRRGGMEWHELTDAARNARDLLLGLPASSASSP